MQDTLVLGLPFKSIEHELESCGGQEGRKLTGLVLGVAAWTICQYFRCHFYIYDRNRLIYSKSILMRIEKA